MEFNRLTDERRSMRAYKNGVVDEKMIRELIETTLKAPSWKNSETGRYYVAISPEKVNEAREKGLPEFNRKNTENCSAIIVATFVKNISGFKTETEPQNEIGNEWGAYDLGIQNAYLILKAKDMGLDTLIMGIRDEKALREMFNIPENEEVVSVIALGCGNKEPKAPARKDVSEVCRIF